MVSKTLAATIIGVEALLVEVEAEQLAGKGGLRIVGLPDIALREARERVRCAILNSGFELPSGEVVVSLAPAELPKTGSGFDLAIALAVLASTGQLNVLAIDTRIFLGELSLDGRLRKTGGVLGTTVLAQRLGGYSLIIPEKNAAEVGLVPGVSVLAAESLLAVVNELNNGGTLSYVSKSLLQNVISDGPTFIDVRGQTAAKRAAEIAAAGGHNLLLAGPPGSGKSMIAHRLPSILPPLSDGELIEVLSIEEAHRGYGAEISVSRCRPFRSPHHSSSLVGLVGGGTGTPKPGEISLAHRGVLFLDELPEFRREVLESLRQPLEAKKITLSRANQKLTLPADFVLVGAMNPCPCGNKGNKAAVCTCSPIQIKKYLARLSGPVLDRIDLQVWLSNPKTSELSEAASEDITEKMRQRVDKARQVQLSRNKRLNSALTPDLIAGQLSLTAKAQATVTRAVEKFKLTARSFMKTLKVARTVADLDEEQEVREQHIYEALSYRIEFDRI